VIRRVVAALVVAASSIACNAVLVFDDPDASSTPTGCAMSGCPLPSLHCDEESGRCVECVENADCPSMRPHCDGQLHLCFQCIAANDCPFGFECVLDSRQCVRSCGPTTPCPPDGSMCADGLCTHCGPDDPMACGFSMQRRVCDSASGQCVDCVNDFQCMDPGRPRCDPATFRCVACVYDRDCPVIRPLCDPAIHSCVSG
jgi:hypothetical protein